MAKLIEEIEFTIFDTETTGLKPRSGDRIVEIAAIRFKGEEKIATFQTLINPHRFLSPAAFEVNKITSDMLKDAPLIETVMPRFLDFIQSSCLCSYNAVFDLGFLNSELKIIGRDFPKDIVVVDILSMARRLMPELGRHALSYVAESLGIKEEQEHRALADVELTLKVFNSFKEDLKKKGIIDFKNFVELFSLNFNLLEEMGNQKRAEIQEAIDLGLKLKIKYLSRNNPEVSERKIIPKEIKQENKHSYLVGFCCLRNEERTFRIDSILSLEVI
jgi:DNA polymerase III epsilon subunit family exonuclease